MKKLADNILNKIDQEKIKPIPKWEFLLKDSVIWGTFVVSVMFGSIGSAITMFLLVNSEVLADFSLASSFLQWIILSIPVVWIVITLIFVLISIYNFKHTDEGYRYSVFSIFAVSLVISILIGSIFYFFGLSERLNNWFGQSIPYYTSMMDTRISVWTRPEEGYLSGTITSIDSKDKIIRIVDYTNTEWVVSYVNANIKGRVELSVGGEIKIIGTMESTSKFTATEIRSWSGSGMMRNSAMH
jgi:hypothetical protein